ncbi:hypothetical protein [Humibacter ginsenosidimutans]|nr:hypothetical protein [Humibacter ginsenosidimutans]
MTGTRSTTHPTARPMMSRGGVRLLFLIPGAFCLFAGLDSALLLLGLPAPVDGSRLPVVHGPLLVFGFVGTVIALERAVAVRRPWAFASPALLGVGGILLLTPLSLVVGQAMFAGGSIVLLLIYAVIWRRQAMFASAVQALGAWLALASAALWMGGLDASALVPGMTGFIVLTIAGERIELARLVAMSRRSELVAIGVSVALAGSVLAAMIWPQAGSRVFGACLLLFVGWLLRFDVATRLATGSRGLPRYIAICLLAGYFWLIVAGLIWLFVGETTQGPWYDGAVHAVFLGFTMGMIMAHAPVILPSVLRRPLPYRPMLIWPVLLMNLSLVVRVLVGDTQNLPVWVQAGGVLGVFALLLFVVLAVVSTLLGPPSRRTTRQRRREREEAA